MAKSPYQSAYQEWSKRVARYQQAGIPSTVYLPIANRDLTKVYGQGSTTMTNADADTAIYAAWKGINPISEAPRHKGGLFGALETVAGNIVPDVGNLITGLIRVPEELAKDIGSPKRWQQTGQDLTAALHDLGSDPGKALRDLASSRQLSLIPGLSDIAAATTPQGRASLEQHPVTAALDVLPLSRGVTAGVAGRLGTAEAGSALEALQAGKVVKGAARGLDRGVLSNLPAVAGSEAGIRASEKGLGVGQAAVGKALEKAHLDTKNRFLSKTLNRGGILADEAVAKEAKNAIDPIFQSLGGNMEAEEAFMQKAEVGDVKSMTAEERAAYDNLGAYQMSIQQKHIAAGDVAQTEFGVYSKNAPIVRHIAARDKAASRVSELADTYTRNVTEAYKIRQEAQSNLNGALARYGKAIAVGGKELEQATRALGVAKQRASGAERRAATLLRKSGAEYGKAKEALKAANIRVERRLTYISGSGVPAHLHPLLRQAMQKRLHTALEDQRVGKGANPEDLIDVTGLPEGRITQSYQDALKELDDPNVDTLNKFRDYVGRQETRQLFADAVHEQLRLAKDGLSPLFFHEPRTTEADQIMRTHMVATKDIPESQTKLKLFNMNATVLNPRLGITEQAAEIIRRDGMQQVYEGGISHFLEHRDQAFPTYRHAAERLKAKGKYRGLSTGALAEKLFAEDYVKFDFTRFGIRPLSGRHSSSDMYLPRTLASNLESFAGGAKSDFILQSRGYHKIMSVFRFSVLYGPRHFAHVVLGGLMPLMLSDPTAILDFPKLWRPVWQATHGHDIGPVNVGGRAIDLPGILTAKFDYKTDASYKMLQQKTGGKMAELFKQSLAYRGVHGLNEQIQIIEDFAQSLYQSAAYFHAIRNGKDEMIALEHARDLVVNLDSLTPFERTVMKQVFPFYSFTRFAVKYLANLPFDHPLRVAILSQISNQAREEWGTGLPQTMMSLFFIGHPKASGNIESVNLRNLNPFRSISSMFTLGGFMENMNPILQAPFIAMGYNPLSGSGPLYPELVFDGQTGTLVAQRPKGDLMLAAEQFVPELGGLDALFGISGNLRTLRATDQGAFDRQLLNMFNIPFAVSQYNLPQTRGKVAVNALKGAGNALVQYRKTGDYSGTIGRFALIPFNGQLVPPQEFARYWEQVTKQAHQIAPGAAPSAVVAKPPTSTASQTLNELVNYYGG